MSFFNAFIFSKSLKRTKKPLFHIRSYDLQNIFIHVYWSPSSTLIRSELIIDHRSIHACGFVAQWIELWTVIPKPEIFQASYQLLKFLASLRELSSIPSRCSEISPCSSPVGEEQKSGLERAKEIEPLRGSQISLTKFLFWSQTVDIHACIYDAWYVCELAVLVHLSLLILISRWDLQWLDFPRLAIGNSNTSIYGSTVPILYHLL